MHVSAKFCIKSIVRVQKTFSGHRHYVQGVAWDPLGECILTQSTDRTMRVLRLAASKGRRKAGQPDVALAASYTQAHVVFRHTIPSKNQYDDPSQECAGQENDKPCGLGCSQLPDPSLADPARAASGDGKNVGSEHSTDVKASTAGYIFQDESLNTFFRRLAFSPEGSFVVAPAATLGPLAPTSRCFPQAK
jgi:chromatin assembly factor 1 subunit B